MTYSAKINARRAIRIMALGVLAMAGGCKSLEVPDYNASSLNDLRANPTSSAVKAAATGVVSGNRLMNNLPPVSYLELVTMMGRESYSLDPSFSPEPPRRLERNESTTASSVWGRMYQNIQQEEILLSVVDNTAGLTAGEKDAIKGFLKTFEAYDLLIVINMYHDAGAIIQIKSDPAGPPSPFATKAQVFARIVTLLDEGKTSLVAAGSATRFPMSLGAGMADFNTAGTFLRLNRALRARVAVYTQNYSAALTALGESFVNSGAGFNLNFGAYHAYSSNSGDITNPFYDALPRVFYAHPSFLANAQLKGDGTKDARALRKVSTLPGTVPKVFLGYSVRERIDVVPTATSPLSIVRNEELILLRAEANLGCIPGGTNTAPTVDCSAGDPSAALTDINFIRQNSGGLDPIASGTWLAMTDTQRLDALLREKQYSLYWEGHRWIDMRRYNRLAQLPHDTPNAKVFPYFLLPDGECVPRSMTCVAPAGF